MPMPNRNSYQEVPYEFISYEQSHPGRIATMAALFGLEAADANQCRVLELGCASGGNLIPMADAFPDSHFVGVDLSDRQIRDGQAFVNQLQLSNVQLMSMDLMDIGPELGSFDYIIAHGVLSWVPHDVQQHVFEICASCLSTNGVAYISYNTYPGWHLRGMIRDMLVHHTSHFDQPEEKLSQARRLANVMLTAASRRNDPYNRFWHAELQRLAALDDAYLFHEHLEIENCPLYFSTFVDLAAQYELRYLCDAEPAVTMPGGLDGDVTDELQRISTDAIHLQQCHDFLQHQMFRRSLLCRAGVTAHDRPKFEKLESLNVASSLRPGPGQAYLATDGRQVRVDGAVSRSALNHLLEIYPAHETFDRLSSIALAPRPDDPHGFESDRIQLIRFILSMWADSSGPLVSVHRFPPNFTCKPSDRPIATAVSRLQASSSPRVTNLLHQTVGLDDFHRRLLLLLDGSRDCDQVIQEMVRLRDSGVLHLGDGEPRYAADPAAFIRTGIEGIASSALLIE